MFVQWHNFWNYLTISKCALIWPLRNSTSFLARTRFLCWPVDLIYFFKEILNNRIRLKLISLCFGNQVRVFEAIRRDMFWTNLRSVATAWISSANSRQPHLPQTFFCRNSMVTYPRSLAWVVCAVWNHAMTHYKKFQRNNNNICERVEGYAVEI